VTDFKSSKPKPSWAYETKDAISVKDGQEQTGTGFFARTQKHLNVGTGTDSALSEKAREIPGNLSKNRTSTPRRPTV